MALEKIKREKDNQNPMIGRYSDQEVSTFPKRVEEDQKRS